MKVLRWFTCLPLLGAFACSLELPPDVQQAYQALPEEIDYNFHVKPILSDRCYKCHGPDENARKADLRLDTEEHAFARLESGGRAFSPGNIKRSKAIQRILSTDPEFLMPHPDSKLALTEEEKAIIVKWVQQGAQWKAHWSFMPPENPPIPADFPGDWTVSNPIDHFIYSRLQKAGLQPSRPADKERLLRRVSMDLTGLPPTLEEMDDFLNDPSPDAYEKVVDRLLASEHFGERLAMEWMDLARYADSHGLHADGWRMMWPWRDWVIEAFNENLPYNDFVTWQLAGDLLPHPTKEQILATAFHRNHTMTAEGGAVDEEFRVEYVADRTNTTATAFLGLTMECARCHDHKFDPISQEEHYMMSAFFNNVKELGMTGNDGNFGPMLLLTDDHSERDLASVEAKIKAKEKEIELSREEISNVQGFIDNIQVPKNPVGLAGYFPFENSKLSKNKDGKEQLVFDGNKNSFSKGKPEIVPGKVGHSLLLSGSGYDVVSLDNVGLFDLHEPYSGAAWIHTTQHDSAKTQVIMGTAGQKDNFWRGWDFYLDGSNVLSFRLIHSFPHNYLHVVSTRPIDVNEWTHVAFTYDGSARASGVRLFIHGKRIETTIEYDRLYKSIRPVLGFTNTFRPDLMHILDDRPVKVGISGRLFTGENGIFNGQIDEIRFYDRSLSTLEIGVIAGNQRTASEDHLVELALHQNKEYQKQISELKQLREEWLTILNGIPEIMVMEEMEEPRPTHVLERGQYDAPMQQVSMGTPKNVLPYPDDLPKNRLGLSHWIFSEENPLTARVTVNRYWQLIFGRGIVKTLNNFGSQGALPSHPALLDWLAVEFRESGWDLKQLIKTMVMANTYQQSSVVKEVLYEADPENILLARAPSYRLSAEMIRDNALAASGLLTKKIGGASVKPYQPDSLWDELGIFSEYLRFFARDSGEDLYRRSLYTFIRRNAPPPYMTTFDAPPRDVCTMQRERTNTPLQALILLNDPQFVEASRVLAERIQQEAGDDLVTSLTHAFRLATGRKPDKEELSIFEDLYHKERERFLKNPGEADALLSVGERKANRQFNRITTAALAVVASTMLNHDEAYMKR